MTWFDVIAEELNIKEPFELPDKLMVCLMDENKREELFDKCLLADNRLDRDTLSIAFQNALGNREALMQDFTPDSICKIIAELSKGKNRHVADICAGSGGLTIKHHATNGNDVYHLEEASKAVIPALLFNLAIRNISSIVTYGDSLTGSTGWIYTLTSGDRYSAIKNIESTDCKMDLVIMNPPYSLEWNPKYDERFDGYELAPKSKADYAFVLHGLSQLDDNGELLAILPHGILFRGGSEGKIRRKLIENNLIDTIIGLPGNMFLNTSIPTVILKLKKNRATTDVLFIDASNDFEKVGKYKELTVDHIEKIVAVAKNRLTVERYSKVVSFTEIKQNNFNLNIPRYVDTFEQEEPVDLVQAMRDYVEISRQIHESEKTILEFLSQLVDVNQEQPPELKEAVRLLEEKVKNYEQLDIFCNF